LSQEPSCEGATMRNDAPTDPIARKLQEAAERKKAEAEAAAGEKLLAADFALAARKAGPEEMRRLREGLSQRCESYNAQRPSGFTELRHIPSGRVDAGKYAIRVDAIEGLKEFQLRVTVGLHPNAAQFMVEPPDITPVVWNLRAEADESSFFWRDLHTGAKKINQEIIAEAFEALSDLLVADA